MFPSEQFDLGGYQQVHHGGDPDSSSSDGFGSSDGRNIEQQPQLYGASGDSDLFFSEFGFSQDNIDEEGLNLSQYEREPQVQLGSDFESSNDLYFDIVAPPFQPCQEEITKLASIESEYSQLIEGQQREPCVFPSASLRILNNCRRRLRQLKDENINVSSHDTPCTKVSGQKLSTAAIIRLAGEKFIKTYSQSVDDLSVLSHPFGSSFAGHSDDEKRDVELVQDLLSSAEKVGEKQFERASKLLDHCDELSSNKGNTIQRLVYYFSEALREKIDRETGTITEKGLGKKQSFEIEEAMMSPSPASIKFHQELPFSQVSQFAGMQAIVDNVAEAKRIHIIDLEIRSGSQWSVFMQALAARCEYPLEHLKITAIGTKLKPKIEETGKWLMSFSQSMGLSFSFKVVMVADMGDLNKDLFELDPEETIAVHSSYFLRTMIARPGWLEHLMRVIRNINPCVMVVTEVEANHNSPVFVNRFIEALFFNGAFFDSMEDCLERDNPNRMVTESLFFSQGIRNIVAAEGEERTIRHVSIDVWRAFFARFGMMEVELSMSSLYQASLVVNNFACGNSCTLETDGNCLIIGWKGTPILSLSAWKFLLG